MYGKNRHRRTHTQPTHHQPSSSSNTDLIQTGFDGLKAIAMTMLCLDPANSSSDDSSNSTPHSAAYIPSANEPSFKLPLPKSLQSIAKLETAAREQIAKIHHDELTQMDALFCVMTEKLARYETSLSTTQQFFLPHVLALREEMAKEEIEQRAEIEMLSGYDATIKESDSDFDEIPEHSSEPRFFQPAAQKPKGWIDWMMASIKQ